jgi:hypothetical protein
MELPDMGVDLFRVKKPIELLYIRTVLRVAAPACAYAVAVSTEAEHLDASDTLPSVCAS